MYVFNTSRRQIQSEQAVEECRRLTDGTAVVLDDSGGNAPIKQRWFTMLVTGSTNKIDWRKKKHKKRNNLAPTYCKRGAHTL